MGIFNLNGTNCRKSMGLPHSLRINGNNFVLFLHWTVMIIFSYPLRLIHGSNLWASKTLCCPNYVICHRIQENTSGNIFNWLLLFLVDWLCHDDRSMYSVNIIFFLVVYMYVMYNILLFCCTKKAEKKKLKRALKNFVNIRTSLLSLSCLLNAHSIGHTHNMNNDFGRKRMYGKERNLNPNFIRLWKAHNSYLMIFEGKWLSGREERERERIK